MKNKLVQYGLYALVPILIIIGLIGGFFLFFALLFLGLLGAIGGYAFLAYTRMKMRRAGLDPDNPFGPEGARGDGWPGITIEEGTVVKDETRETIVIKGINNPRT